MELAPSEDDSKNTFYLPHHAVIKESSTTTKLRVVFDASAKTTSGISLNDQLMVGPTIQQDLFSIIARFRTHKYVFTADIAKMYRQIYVHPSDRNFQRILWRDYPEAPIKTFQLNTVTYGTASAPYLAIKCMQHLAHEERTNFPLAYLSITNNFYVDDLLTGANSMSAAVELRDQIIKTLLKGGFHLRKWASNHPNLIPCQDGNQLNLTNSVNLDKENETKTLGLIWNFETDTLKYSVKSYTIPNKLTKRVILSTITQLFDPLGLIGPILITPKILLQKLWAAKLGWDDAIPTNIMSDWQKFLEDLPSLNNLAIPRGIMENYSSKIIEIHGFCDASELAYGACIYIRTVLSNNSYHTQLLCAKARVAPLKTISLPRLELSGAFLLAQLANKVTSILSLNITKHYYWSDSTIVLAWLAASPNNWKTFVANRVADIQGLTNVNDWHHIRTNYNPADIISRGMLTTNIVNSKLWWNGPEWLCKNSANWPKGDTATSVHSDIPEQKRVVLTSTTEPEGFHFGRCSSYLRAERAMAYALRFVNNIRNPATRLNGSLSLEELLNSATVIYKSVQQQEFSRELKDLKGKGQVHPKSKLISLTPFIDNSGLIRVGGRLKNAQLPKTAKHPIVLPSNHHIIKLLIKQEHRYQLHGGVQCTLASLRQRFWPIAAKNVVRKIIYACKECFRANPRSIEPLMGDLPAERVEITRPFFNSGVDYAGPILIREGRGRGRRSTKAYIALFICLATKAIHIELVVDLTTDSFLNALKRFISRRGNVCNIYSDNAKNFIGAQRELRDLYKLFQSTNFNSVTDLLTTRGTKWHFIPPRSPHFGGIWEAGIKSVKYHLKRIVGNNVLTYEEMYTFLTLIEACLNSRPLTPLSNDPNDLSPLTPGHFLIGNPLTALPEPNILNIASNRLSRYQLLESLRQHFWVRWSKEFLTQMQQRTKWRQQLPNLQPGLLVILREENVSPLRWQLGRVTAVHPGSDGIVRVVSLKTSTGVLKRSVTKVCVLPNSMSEIKT